MSTGGDPSATTFGTQVPAVPSCNQPHSVKYKHGWPGLFTGENQSKAMQRALSDLNSRGLKVTAATSDQWSFWKRLGFAYLQSSHLGSSCAH